MPLYNVFFSLQNISDNSLPLWEDRNDDALCFSYSWSDTRARVPNYANMIPYRGHNSGSATTLLHDELQKQEIISSRVSEFLAVSSFRIAQLLPHEACVTCFSPWALFGSYAFSAMVFILHKDFTLRARNKCVGLDAQMNLTLSLSHYNECPLFKRYVFLVGDRLLCNHGEAISLLT